MSTFDDTLRRPRTLPCGHTLCTLCINGLKKRGAVTCPTCRVNHTVPKVGQFPVSYAVEGLIRKLRGAQVATTGHSRRTQEREAELLVAIRTCQDEETQLTGYQTILGGWGSRQQRLEDELQTLMEQSKSAREMVRWEESRVEGRQEEVRQRKHHLNTELQSLRTDATQHEPYKVYEDAWDDESQRTAAFLGTFPDVHAVTTIAKVASACHAALQASAATAANQAAREAEGSVGVAAGTSNHPAALAATSSIAARLRALLTQLQTANDLPPDLLQGKDQLSHSLQTKELSPHSQLVKDLLIPTKSTRELLEAGLVFAVSDVKGQSRHAKITLVDGRLHIHSLQLKDPPTGALTIQMEELVPATPPCEVFLDLAWPSSAARRVVVSLPRDTSLSRQFMMLCAGQRGACYARTRLVRMESEGGPGECLIGGNYLTDYGVGGAALLPDLGQGVHWRPGRAGDVMWGWGGDPACSAHFCIFTRNCLPDIPYPVFGEVVRGMEVVVEAALHRPITDVTVLQCGVLIKDERQNTHK